MQQAFAEKTVFLEELPPLTQDPDHSGAVTWANPDYNARRIECHA